MIGGDVVSGIVLLAIAVISAMMVITCVKDCSPGVYVAGAGGALACGRNRRHGLQ